jgi:uncharacterized phage protein (TIGR02220 family)
MNIEIDIKKIKKEYELNNFSIVEYLLLAFLYEKPDIELDEVTKELLYEVENKEYIRIIDDHIYFESKTIKLLDSNTSKQAKEIMDYYNELKSKYLGVDRATSYGSHLSNIKARLLESKENTVEDIKNMLDYMFEKWSKNYEMKRYLRPQTLFNKSKFDNYMDMAEMDKDWVEIKQSKMA